jgi:cytochrome c556
MLPLLSGPGVFVRNLLLLALGIALGAMAASVVLNALNRRDAYARGVMQVLQQHAGALRNQLRTNACTRVDAAADKALLAALTEEIERSVYADSIPEPPFREYAQHLRDAVAELPTATTDCTALAGVVTKIGNACDACHREYR